MELPHLKIHLLAVYALLFLTSCATPVQNASSSFPAPPYSELTNFSFTSEKVEKVSVSTSSIDETLSSIKRLYSTKNPSREQLEELSSALFRQLLDSHDPEVVIMTILAASTCHHPLSLNMGLSLIRSSYPVIQLAAIQALASLDTLEANAMLVEALRSDYPIIRLEAGWHIAQKKSPQAFFHIDALRQKLPEEFLPYIGELYALEGSPSSIQRLKQLLHDTNEEVVIETLLAMTRNKITSLADTLTSLESHSPAVLEALAASLSRSDSSLARTRLTALATHPSPTVALQASLSLTHLGDLSYQEKVYDFALQENPFALLALGSCASFRSINLLSSNRTSHLNLCIAELMQRDNEALSTLKTLLLLPEDELILPCQSTGRSLFYWDISPLEMKPRELSPTLIETSLRAKEYFLSLALELDEASFLEIASTVFDNGQLDLYPALLQLLENKHSDGCRDLLSQESMRVGAPYNRAFATLGLMRLNKDVTEKELVPLLELSREKQAPSWRFPLPWIQNTQAEERPILDQAGVLARLYIETVSSLAEKGSPESIQILVNELSLAPQKYIPFIASALLHATL